MLCLELNDMTGKLWPCRYGIRDDLAYENLRELSLRIQPHDKISAAGTVNIFNSNMDDTLTWDFVEWVRTVTKMPVFVKVRPCLPKVSMQYLNALDCIPDSNATAATP